MKGLARMSAIRVSDFTLQGYSDEDEFLSDTMRSIVGRSTYERTSYEVGFLSLNSNRKVLSVNLCANNYLSIRLNVQKRKGCHNRFDLYNSPAQDNVRCFFKFPKTKTMDF